MPTTNPDRPRIYLRLEQVVKWHRKMCLYVSSLFGLLGKKKHAEAVPSKRWAEITKLLLHIFIVSCQCMWTQDQGKAYKARIIESRKKKSPLRTTMLPCPNVQADVYKDRTDPTKKKQFQKGVTWSKSTAMHGREITLISRNSHPHYTFQLYFSMRCVYHFSGAFLETFPIRGGGSSSSSSGA